MDTTEKGNDESDDKEDNVDDLSKSASSPGNITAPNKGGGPTKRRRK